MRILKKITMVKLRKTRLLTVVLILLTFVGQVTASTVVHCNMQLNGAVKSSEIASQMENTANFSDTQVDHSAMDHAAMGHSMPTAESNTVMMDCCQVGNDCSMGSCLTVFVFNDIEKINIGSVSLPISLPPFSATSRTRSTLFRPPIFS